MPQMITQVSVYPNPFSSTLSFEMLAHCNESIIVQMLNEQQKIIKMMSWSLMKGTNKFSFDDFQSLSAGNYYFNIKNMEGKNLFITKLVKI